jgi:hypothetical protein
LEHKHKSEKEDWWVDIVKKDFPRQLYVIHWIGMRSELIINLWLFNLFNLFIYLFIY